MAKQATIKTIEQNDNVSLYSICFNGNELSEYEKFLTAFKDNGGVKTTRTYQEDETLSGYVMDLQKFDDLLRQAQRSGSISIENNVITGIDTATFEL